MPRPDGGHHLLFEARQDGLNISGPASARVGKHWMPPRPTSIRCLMVADRGRLCTFLKDLARTLQPSVVRSLIAFFDPAHAPLPERATDLDPDRPALALCEPTRCPNARLFQPPSPGLGQFATRCAILLREKRLF